MGQVRSRLAVCLKTAGLMGSCLALLTACGREYRDQDPSPARTIRLAAAFGTSESGLLASILPAFEQESGLRVEAAVLSSGAAIDAAMKGEADVILTHDREAENAFVREGYGLNRRDLMDNDFVLLAPPTDPAGVVGWKSVRDAIAAIGDGGYPFISRGDRSGTHTRELSLWRLAGTEPAGPWYILANGGMLETLRMASDRGAYALADRGTYRQHEDELALVIAVENDNRLVNSYSVIAVNPARVPSVNYAGAMKLIEFLVSPAGQNLIGEYGRDRFGMGLFVPVAAR